MKGKEIKLSKLLIKLKDYIEDESGFDGMCISIVWAGFDLRDRWTVERYLRENRVKTGWWWKRGNKAPRLKWLTTHIKKLKTKGL